MNALKLLNSMIDTYETHLQCVDDLEWWGSDFEIALQNQINHLLKSMEIKNEEELEDALFKATLEEMVAYWREWIEEKKWELNDNEVVSLDIF